MIGNMMKTTRRQWILLSLTLVAFIASSCKEEQLSQQQEEAQLKALFIDIEAMTTSISCEDPSEWFFSALGSKACGGPAGYVSYSSKIDTVLFLQKVQEYSAQQEQFNKRWGIISNCTVTPQPTGVFCENGAPVFTYYQ